MKIVSVIITLLCVQVLHAQELWSPLEVDVTRSITKDLFESNAVPYIQPMVTAINATSNARFYNTAFVPKSVERPYFRVSGNGMVGYIPEDMKWYTPTLYFGPRVNVADELLKFGSIKFVDGRLTYVINPTYNDTLGLTTTLVKELLRDALDSNYFGFPSSAATLFGYLPDSKVKLPGNDKMLELLHQRPEYKVLDSAAKAGLDTLLTTMTLPSELTLPPGVNMTTLIAAVPQLEIGALFGTELLLRFIPPVEFDKNIGEFSFWGVGLKHSLSQYFPERWFDCAVQGAYQGTNLKNTIGFTQSKLEANATIWSGNIHVSKELWNLLNIYSGFNYESINVVSTYSYVLPQEIQLQLGLLPPTPPGEVAVPTEEQPGDQNPQSSVVVVNGTNMKWTVGASLHIGDLWLAADYSVSQFNIFSFGLAYTILAPQDEDKMTD